MKISKNRQTLFFIVSSYFVISTLYIIFSDKLLLYLFRNDTSNTLFHEIQSYKGIAFILSTAVILFGILRKRDAITEKYIENLKNNKLKYNNLFKNMLHGVIYTTTDGLILAVNKAFLDILDTTDEEVVGQSIYSQKWKLIRGDNTPLDPFENQIKTGIETRKPVRDEIIGFLNPKTNAYLWLKINSVLEFNSNDKEPYRVLITVDDITSLKNTQDKLENTQKEIKDSLERIALSEFLLKEANTMAKIGVYEINTKKDSMHFSDEMYNIFNIPLEQEYPLEATRNAFKKQSKVLLTKVVKECMEKGFPFDVELEIELPEKETSWTRLKGKPIYDKNNEIIGRRGILQDITDTKKAQLELELSKNRLQASLELVKENEYLLKEAGRMANIGYWGYDKKTDTINWSDNLHKIYGTDPKKGVPDINMILSVFNEESKQRLIKATLNLTTNGVPYEIELQMTNFKNEKKWLRNIGEAIYNDKNEIIGRRGVSQDITQEKIKQQLLDQKNERLSDLHESLNLAQKLSHVGSWKWDMTTDKAEWSDEMYNIYGVTKESFYPSNKNVTKFVLSEDLHKLELGIASLLIDKMFVPFEFRIQRPSGEIRHLYIQALKKNSEENIFGVTKDITEQKLAMSKVEEAEKMYRLLADNANDMICLHELNSTFKYISPSIKTLLGYETSDFIGKQIFDLVHKEDITPLKKAIKKSLLKDTGADTFIYRAFHKKGHVVWLESLGSTIFKDKKLISFITSTRDITQWVLAKKEIQEYQTSLQKLTTEITLIEEKQKKEIATNIHDHLSQSLVISRMRISEMKKKPELKKINEDLLFLETHIYEALENSRKITYELSPPVLYQLGIIDALNWFLDNTETTHKIECQINSNTTNIKFSDVKSILLYRSIQEVITNIIKYANASLITLDINKNNNKIDFLITDNGVGFDTSILNKQHHNHSGSGFGLFTVKERIKNIQGEFSIISKTNTGTIVKIIVPLTE